MDRNWIVAIVVFCRGLDFAVGDYCHTNGISYSYSRSYCSDDCCGYSPNEYCCELYNLNIGAIAGGVIGGIILLCVVIAIVCVICQKSQRRPGHVVQPAAATVIMAHNQQGYGMAQQPQYPPQPNAGPSYGINPAYPPPYPGNSDNAPPPPPKY